MCQYFGILLSLALAISACSSGTKPPLVVPETLVVPINRIDDSGIKDNIGSVTLKDTPQGLELIADLRGLPSGVRGFHIHENPDCGPADKDGKLKAGFAAGSHLMSSGDSGSKHLGPRGLGHLGDLPSLEVAINGACSSRLIAPRVKMADVKGRSLMIHAGGDNFSDDPMPLGGGGDRIACGAVK